MNREERYEIRQIRPDTWMIQEETVRFFLLAGMERALLIDSGDTVHHAKEIAAELCPLPCILANTHTDGDHTGSNHEFDEVYMSPAEYMYYRKTQNKVRPTVRPLWDGDVIELGERPVACIALPGHTPGSMAFLDQKNRYLFSGDSVQNGTIYLFGEQRDIVAYEDGLRRLDRMGDQFDRIFPCHADACVEPEILPCLLEGVRRMRAGLVEPVPAVYLDTPVKEYHIGPAVILYDEDVVFPEL